jgi:hypothetical protein
MHARLDGSMECVHQSVEWLCMTGRNESQIFVLSGFIPNLPYLNAVISGLGIYVILMRAVLLYVFHVGIIEMEFISHCILHTTTSEIHVVHLTVLYFKIGYR